MTKRFGNFEITNNKRPKLEENLDELWGDDLDDDAFDDCIRIATQVEEKIVATQDQNLSIVPNYNAFKAPANLFSSTQMNNSIQIATTSDNEELKRMKGQIEEKVGEISILRKQLQDTKTKLYQEQQKTIQQYNEKLQTTQKEFSVLQSELEFKNLEISNLKQKILNITRHNFEVSQASSSKCLFNKTQMHHGHQHFKNTNNKKQPILDPISPLGEFASTNIFTTCYQENYSLDTILNKQYRNTISYLKNVSDDDLLKNKSVASEINGKELNLDYIYPEISYLVNCAVNELDLEENVCKIHKILCVSIQLLTDLKENLLILKSKLRAEDIQQIDACYLKHDFVKSDTLNSDQIFERDKMGIKAGQTILLISRLLPHSLYLRNYLIYGKKLEECDSSFTFTKNKYEEPNYYLELIESITQLIGQIRSSHEMSGFLYSVVELLIVICEGNYFDDVWYNICKISKFVIFSRPLYIVICKFTFLLKHASVYPVYVDYIFKRVKDSGKASLKRGVLLFNEDSCCFHVFAVLFANTVFKQKEFPIKVCINMLSFMYNTFKKSTSLHYKDIMICECVVQLYKLEIDVVFHALDIYNNHIKCGKLLPEDWNTFFKHEITTKVLHLMTFNSYELTEKYVSVYSEYKEIQLNILDHNLDELEKLAIVEDTPDIPNNHKMFSLL